MKPQTWLILLLAGGLGFAAWHTGCRQRKLVEEKIKLDTVYVIQKTTLRQTRTVIDSALQGPGSIPKDSARVLVKSEREACTRVIETCDKRVKNLEDQLKPGWFLLFGALAYQIPADKPLLHGPVSFQGGATVRVRPKRLGELFIDTYRDIPLLGDNTAKPTWNVRVRKQVRIF